MAFENCIRGKGVKTSNNKMDLSEIKALSTQISDILSNLDRDDFESMDWDIEDEKEIIELMDSLNGAATKIGGALWKIQCLKDPDLTM